MEETRLKEKVCKRDFCATIQNYTYSITGKRWNQEDARLAYDAFVDSLKALVSTYGKVVIEGLGNFEIVFRNGKKVKNNLGLATKHKVDNNNMIDVPGFQIIKFNAADMFKAEIKNLHYTFVSDEEEGED